MEILLLAVKHNNHPMATLLGEMIQAYENDIEAMNRRAKATPWALPTPRHQGPVIDRNLVKACRAVMPSLPRSTNLYRVANAIARKG